MQEMMSTEFETVVTQRRGGMGSVEQRPRAGEGVSAPTRPRPDRKQQITVPEEGSGRRRRRSEDAVLG